MNNDLISRSALIEIGAARKIIEVVGNWNELPGIAKAACTRLGIAHKKLILDAPAVDPESLRPRGRWIYKWDAERDPKKLFVRIVCSECNLHTGQKSNYCPNCGAKMMEG